MALYHYRVKVGIFVAHVQAESWDKALKKVMESDLYDGLYDDSKIKCIEVRRIRGKDDR